MALRADDGTVLPVKEGVVLDPHESTVLYESPSNESQGPEFTGNPRVKVFNLGIWVVPLAILVFGLVLVFGTVILSAFIALMILISLLRAISRVFGLKV